MLQLYVYGSTVQLFLLVGLSTGVVQVENGTRAVWIIAPTF